MTDQQCHSTRISTKADETGFSIVFVIY